MYITNTPPPLTLHIGNTVRFKVRTIGASGEEVEEWNPQSKIKYKQLLALYLQEAVKQPDAQMEVTTDDLCSSPPTIVGSLDNFVKDNCGKLVSLLQAQDKPATSSNGPVQPSQ